ncbi:hypothetical protein MOO44_08305 [Nicoliella spurrieriana]|uniref:Lipoprotein n=1 Tax=Nicoliella spurrieriana TaxID=2925830 RepID=A0A976X5R3_9LACO|nr:hypothetical protein [Nicoliella spurrieriana]UQS86852.1 hypothetical protein MOO44_08305 [Nicoliella spurrieriana]
MKKALILGISSLTILLAACGNSNSSKKAAQQPKYSQIDTTRYKPINQQISVKKLLALKPNNTKYFHHEYSIKGEIVKIGKKFQGSATYVIKDPKTDLTYASVTSGTKTFKGFKVGDKATFAINGLTRIAKNNNLNGLTTEDNPSRLSTVTNLIGKY